MADQATLYDQVVRISSDYLGPAADRFMTRQISTHLGKKPQQLEPQDIAQLVDWVKLTFALLTDDAALIQSFSDQLTSLAHTKPDESRKHGNA